MGYVPEHLKFNITNDKIKYHDLWLDTKNCIEQFMCDASDSDKISDLVYKSKYPTEIDEIIFTNAEINANTFKPIIINAIYIDRVDDAIYLIDTNEISNSNDKNRLLHLQKYIKQHYAVWCHLFSDVDYAIDINSLRPGDKVTVALSGIYNDSENDYHILASLVDIIRYQDDDLRLYYLDENYCFHTTVDYLNLYNKLTENKRVKQSNSSSSSSEGCYIASAVYGSYDCPQVWTLRRYRDYKLRQTTLGRLFVKLYYFISPKAVSAFGDNHLFKSFFKRLLDKKVSCLKEQGYSDKKYYD